MHVQNKTFSLRELFASITCFAMAIGIFSFCNRFNPNRTEELRGVQTLLVVGSAFGVGILIGAGCGVLIHRLWKGALLGFFVMLPLVAIAVVSALALHAIFLK